MCSATNTRLRRTARWIALQRASTGANARPAKISSSGALSSAFHDATTEWSCSDGNVASMRSTRSCQRARTRADQRPRLVHLGVDLLLRRPRFAPPVPTRARARIPRRNAASSSHSANLVRERELDVDPLDAVGVVAQPVERDDDVLVDLERVGVAGDRRGARAVLPEPLARLRRHRDEALGAARVGDPDHLGGGLRHRVVRLRRRCRRAAPSSAGRGASPWSRSRRPSRSARPGARGRRGPRLPAACRDSA